MAGNETLAALNGNPMLRAAVAEVAAPDTSQHIGNVLSPGVDVYTENFRYSTTVNQDLNLDSLRGVGALAKVVRDDAGATVNASIDEHMQKVLIDYHREIEAAVRATEGLENAPSEEIFIARKLRRRIQDMEDIREYRRLTLLSTAANYGATHKAAGVNFNATTVYSTLDNARNTIIDDFGKAPNVLALGSTAARILKQSSTIKAVYTGERDGRPVSNEELAEFFEVDLVVISRFQRKINGTNTRFFPADAALLAYVDQNPQTVDDQTLSTTPYMTYDGAEIDARTYGPFGVEKMLEAAAAVRYRPIGTNYLAGYLWTGIVSV